MTESRPIVRIRNLIKSFGTLEVLKGVNLEVQRGEVVVIIGPSGSGKTTMLRCVNALETYDDGSIEVDGVEIGYHNENGKRKRRSDRELSAIRADIGMVFQLFNLFPHLTALENVMLGLTRVRRMEKVKARESAAMWLNKVGLKDKLDSLPAQLSGGQQQRVGIARAVAMEPKILLLDEITSSLDPELIGEVLEVVLQLARDGMTMLCVTHEISFAQDLATRVMFIDEGLIIAEGTPEEIIINPQQERLQSFLSRFQNLNKYTYEK